MEYPCSQMTEISEATQRKTALAKDLENQIAYAKAKAVCNHRISLGVMLAALACSVAAAVSGVFFGAPSQIVGGIALLPPLLAYAALNMKFDGKSSWHYRKLYALDSLHSRLLYQLPEHLTVDNIAAIARERDAIHVEMQSEWDRTLAFNWGGIASHNKPQETSRLNEPSGQPSPGLPRQ
jgi:hypothetical protein